jgi:hypothetical protein
MRAGPLNAAWMLGQLDEYDAALGGAVALG